MLNREIERDILPYCVENEISVVPYGPLAFGILGGNYTKDLKLDEGDCVKAYLYSKKAFTNGILIK